MPQRPSSRSALSRSATRKRGRVAASQVENSNGRDSGHYDRKLDEILRRAAEVFRARGYHQASIRDISRATEVSLAGLYYYFSSKEELLYLIQRHAFETLLGSVRVALERVASPEDRLRTFVRLHLEFFLEHPNEMKVLTHEEEWLADTRRREVRAIKKAYYQLCLEQVEALKRARGLSNLNTRLAVLSLFGMMNWIYTWHNPKVDPGAAACGEQMAGIFLDGILRSSTDAHDQAGARWKSGPIVGDGLDGHAGAGNGPKRPTTDRGDLPANRWRRGRSGRDRARAAQ